MRIGIAKKFISPIPLQEKKHHHKIMDSNAYSKNRGYVKKWVSIEVLRNQASELLPGDSLTILCELTLPKKPKEPLLVRNNGNDKMVQLGQNYLLKDLESAFSHKEFTDVQIQCGEKVFDCHQFMLSARSPVFRAMFQAEMKEKKTKMVNVKDVDPDVFSEMLTFIYTGKCPNLDNLIARSLLASADKYQMEQLKTICVEKLCENIDVNNCVDFLVMGDMHQAEDLKKFSLDFIAKNVATICQTDGWKESLVDRQALMFEVIEAFGREMKGRVTKQS